MRSIYELMWRELPGGWWWVKEEANESQAAPAKRAREDEIILAPKERSHVDDTIIISVQSMSSRDPVKVRARASMSIEKLYERLKDYDGIPVDQRRLVFQGR